MIVNTDIGEWEDFEWDPRTGIGQFTRDVPWQLDPLEVATVSQPSRPEHEGWAELAYRPQRCLSLM